MSSRLHKNPYTVLTVKRLFSNTWRREGFFVICSRYEEHPELQHHRQRGTGGAFPSFLSEQTSVVGYGKSVPSCLLCRR